MTERQSNRPQTRRSRFDAVVKGARQLAFFVFGALIMKHEVYEVGSPDYFLTVVGLFLLGVPVVELLDALRQRFPNGDDETKGKGK